MRRKRYASGRTLYRHRKSACKGDSKINGTAIYTLPSFIRVSVDSWTPAVGDRFECIQLDDHVVVEYDGKTVGFVPKSITWEFIDFLQHGKIYARVTGVPVKARCGFQVPIDYIFVKDSLEKDLAHSNPNSVDQQEEVSLKTMCGL